MIHQLTEALLLRCGEGGRQGHHSQDCAAAGNERGFLKIYTIVG